MLDFPRVGLQETFNGKKWEYEPFMSRLQRLMGDLWESSGLGYRVAHGYRVFQLVSQMRHYPELAAEFNKINWPLIKIAALFHDVGLCQVAKEVDRLDIFDPQVLATWIERHADYAPQIISETLADMLEPHELAEVSRLAAKHTAPVCELDLACKILQDADNIDERGIIQLWRMSTIAAHHEKDVFSQFRFYFSNRDAMVKETMEKLHFPTSRQIAKGRLQSIDRTMLVFWIQFNGVDAGYSGDAFPWELWQRRVEGGGFTIDRPKGSAHPERPDIIYPLDYGFLPEHMGWEGMEQDIFIGDPAGPLTGILLTADFHKGDCELKLLWGMSHDEMEMAANFYNARPMEMIALLVKR